MPDSIVETTPVVKTIDVACDPKTAFSVFTDRFSNWWPKEHHSVSAMSGSSAASVTLEPKQGGRVYETGPAGEHHDWGSVLEFRPGELLVLSWQINVPPEQATRVEVRFSALEAGGTRVELTHSQWHVFGDKAEDMRSGYNQGWVRVFEERYMAACEAA